MSLHRWLRCTQRPHNSNHRNNLKRQGGRACHSVICQFLRINIKVEEGCGFRRVLIFQPLQPHVTLNVAPSPSKSTSRLGPRNTWIHLAELCFHLDGRNNQEETDGCAGPAPSHVIFQSNEQQCGLFSRHGAAAPGGDGDNGVGR